MSGAPFFRLGGLLLCTGVLACGNAATPLPAGCLDPTCPPTGYVPFVAGELTRVYTPARTRYLNDHTLVKGPDGTWHLYGITNETFTGPLDEKQLLHATAPSLSGPWTDRPDILMTIGNESVLWAPHVIALGPSAWAMFYWAGTAGLRRADSSDLTTWIRAAGSSLPGGRDPFLLIENTKWLLYSVGVDAMKHGQILVAEMAAGGSWSAAVPIITAPIANAELPEGDLESPFVVPYRGQYYLFLSHVSQYHGDYARTLVFRSVDPKAFTWRPVTTLHAHAAEIVVEGDRMYVTSAGWTPEVGEASRGLLLAPLDWIAE